MAFKSKPLSIKANCPADMNPEEDFAVMATGQSLVHAGMCPFTCFATTTKLRGGGGGCGI